jgi:5'-methylthioadenosine phosphorylase
MTAPRVVGVIGGSGLYGLDGLEAPRAVAVDTPWGPPSGPVIHARLGGVDVRFLARHGEGHRIPPSAINYRANIAALKMAGVTDILSVSACGSFREELAPGVFVIVDQFIDRTQGRASSFFEAGCVAHVSIAHPVCAALGDAVAASLAALGVRCVRGGVYVCMDGPQFSSRAESLLYKSWGADVIGMTNMPEAKLAREAEIAYTTIAMVTDYDCWRDDGAHVEVTDILEIMHANTANAKNLLADLMPRLGPTRRPSPSGADTALDHALITPRGARDPAVVERLAAIAGRAFAAGR